jgi:methionyl-tRNA synthetase
VPEYLKDFPDQQDLLRYVLCANAPEAKDNDFTWKDFQTRVNSELSGNLGNFVNRAFVMMHKLCAGRVPKLHEDALNEIDKAIINDIENAKVLVEANLENYKFREALSEIMALSAKGNKYLQVNEPWNLVKTLEANPENQKRIDNCIHLSLQICANLAILINPFLPFTAQKMCHMMKVVDRMLDWENAGTIDLLKVNYPLREPQILFKKVEDTDVAAQVEKLRVNLVKSQAANTNTNTTQMQEQPVEEKAAKAEIQYDDFAKMDFRVGTILAAEKVEKADKLLKLEVDMGTEKRTIVSGIAMHFKAEEIVGKQVTVVANLAPRKMRGIESQGMILMTENKDGRLIFVSPLETADPGSEVK